MDFIEKCFEKNDDAFTEKLEGAGFSVEQAKDFLPVTASGIMHSIKNTHLEVIITMLLSDDPSQILNSINTNEIADTMGMNSEQVASGFEAIAPVLSQAFTQQSNEIVEATASLAWSPSDELINSVKKAFDS